MKDFPNIVVKKFDWENYIYKCVLGAKYVKDNTDWDEDRDRYYDLIVENLDVYNYIIKYEFAVSKYLNPKMFLNLFLMNLWAYSTMLFKYFICISLTFY